VSSKHSCHLNIREVTLITNLLPASVGWVEGRNKVSEAKPSIHKVIQKVGAAKLSAYRYRSTYPTLAFIRIWAFILPRFEKKVKPFFKIILRSKKIFRQILQF